MNYIAILGKGLYSDTYKIALINSLTFRSVAVYDNVQEVKIAELVRRGNYLINASVQGWGIIDDVGSFSRLETRNGVAPRIIVAALCSKAGQQSKSNRPIGYIVMDTQGRLTKVKRGILYDLCEQAKDRGLSYIQNGIYKVVNGTPCISCYNGKTFPLLDVQTHMGRV